MVLEITVSIANILYLAGGIVCIGGAIKILYEAKKALTRPLEEIDKKFDHYDDCLENDKEHLEKIDVLIEELGEAVNLLVSSQKVSLLHMESGNNTGEIKEEIKELDKWLVRRKEYKA